MAYCRSVREALARATHAAHTETAVNTGGLWTCSQGDWPNHPEKRVWTFGATPPATDSVNIITVSFNKTRTRFMSSSPRHPTGTLSLSSAQPAALSRSPWEPGADEWNKQKVKASVAVTSSVCKHSPDPNRVLYPINILSTASLGEVHRTVNPVFRNKRVYDKPWVIVIPPLPLSLKRSTINLI